MSAFPDAVDLAVGARVPCLWRDGRHHKAEIVEKRMTSRGYEFYVHYLQFNKRLDQWVTGDAFELDNDSKDADLVDADGRKMTRNMKRKYDAINHVEKHAEDFGDGTLAALEKEHEEITKVKNIQTIELGKYEIDTWYFSPYPEEFASREKLFICEFCLKYMRKAKTLDRHKLNCEVRRPPGDEIYRDEKTAVSVFEVDGMKNKIYCQNLCLLAKLFLDHKTLYYDVEPFLFYVVTENDAEGSHVAGYFSKEKESLEGNNLACIMTLPPYQRKGYGKFMITLSYALSKREHKVGSPEKPLSDLGLLSFRSYWSQVLLQVLKDEPGNPSVRDLSNRTAIRVEDIVQTLTALGLMKYFKGQHVIYVTPKLIEEHMRMFRKPRLNFEDELLMWGLPADTL